MITIAISFSLLYPLALIEILTFSYSSSTVILHTFLFSSSCAHPFISRNSCNSTSTLISINMLQLFWLSTLSNGLFQNSYWISIFPLKILISMLELHLKFYSLFIFLTISFLLFYPVSRIFYIRNL